jgi:hypothetical protein
MVRCPMILRRTRPTSTPPRCRFEARINDPVKHWKLSPMDTESVRRWWDYAAAYQRMIEATHTPEAPWHIVPTDDKRRARLNLIRHLLDSVPYKKMDMDLPKIPKAQPAAQGRFRGSERRQADPQSTTEDLDTDQRRLCTPPGALSRPRSPSRIARLDGVQCQLNEFCDLIWINGEAQNRDHKSVAAAIGSARDSRCAPSTPLRQCG